MNYPTLLLAILGLAAAGGAATAWWKRSEGTNTIDLLKTNIESYKISESQHLQRIAELEATMKSKDKALSDARMTLRTIVKEFKEYKNGN